MKIINKPTITAHCLIRNEERWIWYAINSIIDYVDKIFVFDTGSTDNTVKIVKSIRSPKIIFEQKGIVDKKKFTKLRQEMLDKTTTDWFLILDGDEVWPNKTIQELKDAISNASSKKEAVVVGQWTCLGDVFHYSKQLSEYVHQQYKGMRGFRLPRAIKTIKGLHCIGDYGVESYADKNNKNISYWEASRLIHIKNKYFHMTFLPRSSTSSKDREVMMRSSKTFYNIGSSFPKTMKYPEVFYRNRPYFIPSPWKKLTTLVRMKGFYYRGLNIKNRAMSILKSQ